MSEINFDYEMRSSIDTEYADCLKKLIKIEKEMGNDTSELENMLANEETLIINNY